MKEWTYLRLRILIKVKDQVDYVELAEVNGVFAYNMRFNKEIIKMSDYLNEFGKKGWEMVSAYKDTNDWIHYHFKRPLD